MSVPHRDLRITAKVELPPGEEGIWSMIGKLSAEGTWSVTDLATFTGSRRNVVQDYVSRLEKAGFVRVADGRVATTRGTARLYEQVKTSLLAPRILRDGTLKPERRIETLWRTMRMLKDFTIEELASYSARDDEPANVPSVRTYVCALCSVGVLARVGEASPTTWQRYRLVKVVGPKAPQILTAKMVFDPNGRQQLGMATSQEVSL